jgi:hypothetical protein
MAKLLQLRGGTTAQHSSFTGALREVTVDTDKDTLVVHDGSTAGGFPIAKASDVASDSKGSDIASADPLVIAAGDNYFIVTGTTGFNDMTVAANTHFFLEFAGALVMTHVGGALDLPSAAPITTVAGDVGEFFSTAANVVTCVNYTKVSGKPVKTDFANADINASAAIVTSKLSGAVTSIASHGLGALATLATVGNGQIDNNSVDEDKLKDALIADFTEVTVASGDSLLLGDATDSGNTKRDTVQGILDLVTVAGLNATPSPDHTINGPQTNTVLAGYTTAIGDLVYLDPNGRWEEADADATSTSISLLGIAMEVQSDGAAVNVALSGSFIVDASWSFGVGVPLYVHTTAGGITATKPTGSGDVVRTVGYALTATTIFFAPSSDYVTLA